MKRVFSDGRREVVLWPRDFLARLCALIPQPRINLVRYFRGDSPRKSVPGGPAFAPTAGGRGTRHEEGGSERVEFSEQGSRPSSLMTY